MPGAGRAATRRVSGLASPGGIMDGESLPVGLRLMSSTPRLKNQFTLLTGEELSNTILTLLSCVWKPHARAHLLPRRTARRAQEAPGGIHARPAASTARRAGTSWSRAGT